MKFKIKDLIYIAICTCIITICSYITIPLTVPFTLQTFAIFFILKFLGGKKGLVSIIVYILLGIVGVPVFSGFKGGLGVILGLTGGYIIGFIFIALIYMIYETLFNKKKDVILEYITFATGLIVCYLFGTIWFVRAYTSQGNTVSFMGALTICVLPFIIPDIIKMVLGVVVGGKVRKAVEKGCLTA